MNGFGDAKVQRDRNHSAVTALCMAVHVHSCWQLSTLMRTLVVVHVLTC